ncbi:MAG: ROK family protein [Bacteroidales bacterium]|nr:ROK family protein [Bacteroidales bacterium]
MRTTLLDIGGTFIKCADGRQIPIPSAGPKEAIAAALREALKDCEEHIGIAIPGPFDYRNGIFRADHKFAAVKGESFRELAGLPETADVRFIHDVCAVLEGAIRGVRSDSNTALVTLGTGLGFAIARRGVVRYGPTLSPADVIWNLPWEGGILEEKVSGRGLRAIYAELGGDSTLTARDIAEQAFHGDRMAFEAYERMGATLGAAIKGLLHENQVDTLLFGGQISQSLDLMEDGLRSHLGYEIRIARAPEKAVFKGIETLFETNQ